MWYNKIIKALLESPLHSMVSKNILLLTYTGSKSGKPYTLPVNYVRVDETLLVASDTKRSWWRSLRSGAPVRLLLEGKEVPAYGMAVQEPEQVARALGDLFAAAPGMARYFNVSLDQNKHPLPEELQKAARSRVIVRLRIEP